jgi:hypothetical protein
MLIDEIERLHVDLWSAKAASADGRPQPESEPRVDSSFALDEPDQLAPTLREKLSRLRRHA